jgi:hypothetical protein
MKNTKKLKKVKLNELGFYLKLINQEFGNKTNTEYAKLIEENFGIECTEKDICNYESLHIELEDYEKLSRMAKFGNEHLIE